MRYFLLALTALFLLLLPFKQGHGIIQVNPRPGAAVEVTYLLEESFDTNPGYDVAGWSESGATINEDYAAGDAPLEGTQSLLVDADATDEHTANSFTASSSVYVYFMANPTTWTGNKTGPEVLVLLNAGETNSAKIVKTNQEKLRIYHGTSYDTGSNAWSAGTTYHVWFEYTKSSGADDGVANLYFAESATKPGAAEATVSDGDCEDDLSKIWLGSEEGDADLIYDKLRVDDVSIGSNPE